MKVVVDFDECASNARVHGHPARGVRGPRRRLPLRARRAPARVAAREAPRGGERLPDGRHLASSKTSEPGAVVDRRPGATGPAPAGQLRPVTHRVLPRRQRPGRPVQLALRPPRAAGRSCCASRTPTPSATARSGSTGIVDRPGWLGMAPDEGPYRQSERADRYQRRPIDALWDGGRPLRLRLHPRGDRRPDQGQRHPRLRRLLPGARPRRGRGPGPALPDPRRRGHRRPRPDPRRRDASRTTAMEDFVVVKSQRAPAVRPGQRGRRPRHGHHPRHPGRGPAAHRPPRGSCCGRPWTGGRRGRRQVPRCRPSPTCPLLVNEQRQEALQAPGPRGRRVLPRPGLPARRLRNYLALLGWSPPGRPRRSVASRQLVDEFRLDDVHHAPAFFDVEKLTHLNGEYIAGHCRSTSSSRRRPWIDPVGSAPPGAGRRGRPSASTRTVFAPLAPLVQERVATLGEVPAMVDFLFLADPPIDEASWDKAIGRDDEAPRPSSTGALDAYAGLRVDAPTPCTRPPWPWPRPVGPQAGQGPGARSGWRSPAAGWGRRSSSRSRCSGRAEVAARRLGAAPRAGWRPRHGPGTGGRSLRLWRQPGASGRPSCAVLVARSSWSSTWPSPSSRSG